MCLFLLPLEDEHTLIQPHRQSSKGKKLVTVKETGSMRHQERDFLRKFLEDDEGWHKRKLLSRLVIPDPAG